jgi:hypothetical protein
MTDAGEVNIKKKILLSGTKYAVLKEDMKLDDWDGLKT